MRPRSTSGSRVDFGGRGAALTRSSLFIGLVIGTVIIAVIVLRLCLFVGFVRLYMFQYLSAHLSVCLFIYLSIYLSFCLSAVSLIVCARQEGKCIQDAAREQRASPGTRGADGIFGFPRSRPDWTLVFFPFRSPFRYDMERGRAGASLSLWGLIAARASRAPSPSPLRGRIEN